MSAVLRFKEHAILHVVGIFSVLIAVVKLFAVGRFLESAFAYISVPAECLEVDTMFNHELDFPVSCFGNTFVIVADYRLSVVIRCDTGPAVVSTVSPERTDIHCNDIIVKACLCFGYGNIVGMLNLFVYLYVMKKWKTAKSENQ